MGMAIAFFDLDKTLLAKNSAALWLMWELRRGRIRLDRVVRATAWLLRYRLGKADLEVPIRASVATLRGVRQDEWARRTQAFYRARVRRGYRLGGLAALEAHRARGDRVVLLSSTHQDLAQLVQADLGLDAVLCNAFATDAAGVFTGELDGTLCFGPGKLVAAQALCTQMGERLADSTFYTDSYSDWPVLAAVGHPVAINPDPALVRAAKRHGWPTHNWGTATCAPAPRDQT